MALHSTELLHTFRLESGKEIASLRIAYHTYGTLNAEKDNVIWVCHALTANSDVADWWSGLFGKGRFFDPDRYFVVCPNNLGSCYGSSGPADALPGQEAPLFSAFPLFSTHDMVQLHEVLRQHLGITRIHTLIGGSQGGQQALTWSVLQPALAERLVLSACNLRHSAWGIAFNETQRMAIASDPSWGHPHKDAGLAGLSTARAIALLSYRNYTTYSHFQADEDYSPGALRRAATYQRHQGSKLCRRFNAWSYWYLSQAMDTHNAAKGFSSAREALRRIQAHTLLIGIHSDLLFPPAEQAELARLIPRATLRYIDSVYGHDGFLTETAAIQLLLNEFYNTANQ